MRVIILAAGKGERLYPMTKNSPKSLLEIGSGRTVLESQLDHIAQAGIRDVTIVTGYKTEQIEAKVLDYRDLDITICYNPFFATSNNLISAWLAIRETHENFVLVNGDDVFKTRVLSGLLDTDDDITMVIDRKANYDQDDMKVVTSGDRVFRVSKDIPLDETNGESIGMILFQGKGRSIIRDTLEGMVRREENQKIFYLAALQEIMERGFPVHYHECSRDDWAEIDFHSDLSFIRQHINKYAADIVKV
ncbi:MAG: phosphocholine cytidylyltransferase family protein [Candidatus Krumholzibacteriota bacterium]|nr:phosphocholine cytidylyltransferase family protein [Candidatus Krumholzibacteriota bacterium]